MFKFLHAADLHLDSPMRALSRYDGCPAGEVRAASREALKNLVRLAIEEDVAFLLIAGDVYDGDVDDHGACLFFVEQMLRLRDAGIPAYLIRGNHDHGGRMTRQVRLPDNVRRFSDDEAESIRVPGRDVSVHGRGFATRSVKENLARAYPDAVDGTFNVGLLHTSLDGREGHDDYAPCTVADLRAKRYGYWALGHIHRHEHIEGDAPIVFAGNLQGRHVRESGAKGAVLVEVEAGRVSRVQHRALDAMRWAVLPVVAAGAASEDDLLERTRASLRDLANTDGRRPTIVRVEWVGPSAAHEAVSGRIDRMANEVRAAALDVGGGRLWVEKLVVRTRPERRGDDLDGPVRAVRDYLDALRADPAKLDALTAELAPLKTRLAPVWGRDLGREPVDGRDRLLAALDQVEPDLIRGLLGVAEAPR